MKQLINSIAFIVVGLNSMAQRDPDYSAIYKQYPSENLKVGMPCPEFILKNVRYHSRKDVSLSDLKGKNVILDFFNSRCVTCFKSMPKVNTLKQKFGNDVEIFFVGLYDSRVEKVYEKYRKAFDFKMPVVYDSILPNRFISSGYPEYIWIGKDGIVTAITNSEDVNAENLSAFVEGRPFKFSDKSKVAEWQSESALVNNPLMYIDSVSVQPRFKIDEDTACLYKSEFGSWDDEKYGTWGVREYEGIVSQGPNAGKAIEVLGSAYNLFYTAYFGHSIILPGDSIDYGNVYRTAILENIDIAAFTSSNRRYWYRLIDRRSDAVSKEDLQKTMQIDLQKYFGYRSRVEERVMPCYKIVVTDKRKAALLKSKGGEPLWEDGNGGIKYRNATWKNFVARMAYYGGGPTIVDETGIDYNVDIEIEAAMQSTKDVNKDLQKYGVSIIKGEKIMKVLVVNNSDNL
jgi:thiol-disulfide isomerase/thioredoxin